MGAANADVPGSGSGVKDWEGPLEVEQERKRVTDLGRILPNIRRIHGLKNPNQGERVFTVAVDEDADGNVEYRRRKVGGLVVLNMRYELEAANHRRVSIDVEDLRHWLVAHFDLSAARRPTRSNCTSLRLLDGLTRKTAQRVAIDGDAVHVDRAFPAGDWRVIASDGTAIHIPRNHASTAVEALTFTFAGERVRATYAYDKNAHSVGSTVGDVSESPNR